MNTEKLSAMERLFATPEVLELILLCLLGQLLPVTVQEDPRSARTHSNACSLGYLLHCSEVWRSWHMCLVSSGQLRRALFLAPDHKHQRSWLSTPTSQAVGVHLSSYHRAPSLRAPVLNPIIQVTFPAYHFRFWHLSLEANGNKYCAYFIITRRDLPNLKQRSETAQGRTISRMLLSQPPCTRLEAIIWEERNESSEYIGRTNAIRDPMIENKAGLTMALVHDRIGEIFNEYRDVAAIKLMTV